MEIDAAQYAAISREMVETGNYLHIYHRGQDYLDKPPLLFWMTSVSVGIFGNTNIAYKLFPSLMLVFGLWATYRFATLWYDQRTGVIASLLLGTTQAFQLMSNDVRTDGILTSFVILSVWLWSLFLKEKKILHLFLAGMCIGGAMLAKGPLGLLIPTLAIGGHLLITRQWNKIFNPAWLILLLVIAIVIAPMCYGLYTQFDLHPEKEVYGLNGPSGLGFYFWTQSFGRITGDLEWSNNTPWYYFIQSILWDLQPWILLFMIAFWNRLKGLWKSKSVFSSFPEWITLSGFVLPFIALSFSKYKLPHYVFPLFPFAAVMISAYLVAYAKWLPKWIEVIQLVLIHGLLLASLLMMFWVFPVHNIWLPVLWVFLYVFAWWWRKKAADDTDRWVLPSLMGVLIFQFVLSLHFYPSLLKYQASSQAGKCIDLHQPERVYWHDKYGFALDYYSDRIIPNAFGPPVDVLPLGTWIYVSDAAVATMPPHKVIMEFDDFKVSSLNAKFLNPETRPEKVKKMYLIELVKRN
jgi:4-amino-4-deoxy-L-arabinose transferase-like glycosyltransferase